MIFPPLIPLSVLVVGFVLNFFLPLGLLAHVLFRGRIVVGAIAFVVGIGMVLRANRIFQRIGTNVLPSQPTLALATIGMFTWTRNPISVGGSLALLGIAIGFALDRVILLLVASWPLVHYGIIVRQECYRNESSATNTGATRRRSHGIGGDSEILFAEELTKQLLLTFYTFVGYENRFCFPHGTADKALFVQPIQRVPIVAFPSSSDNLAKQFFTVSGEPEQRQHHVVHFVFIIVHDGNVSPRQSS